MGQLAMAVPSPVARRGSGTHLVILTARLKQALLDGKLQQVVFVITGGCLPLAAQNAVASWGLEQGGGDLTAAA